MVKDEVVEWAILSAQDWLLESEEAKAAIPSRKQRLLLLNPMRLQIEWAIQNRFGPPNTQ